MIETTQDLKISVNGHDNYLRPAINHKDALALIVLMNRPDFPKSKKDISKPEFKDARYYLTTDEELDTVVKAKLSDKKKVYVYLSELFKEGANKQKPWEIAFYMGIVKKQTVSVEELELKIDTAINSSPEVMAKFLEACELTDSELQLWNMFEKGIEYGIIRYGKDGMYYRGSVNYRATKAESIEYLQMPNMITELAALREEVQKKSKLHKTAR
jgi:hypothetical protein